MKMSLLAPVFGAALVAGLSSAGGAGAVTTETFYLNVYACGGPCLTGVASNLGSVTVKDVSGALEFSVNLTDAWFSVAGKGDPQALAFSIKSTGLADSLAGLKIQVSTPGFTGTMSRDINVSPFGTFHDTINYVGSTKIDDALAPNSLSFVVTDDSKNLSLANISSSMISKIGAIYIAADLFSNNLSPSVFAATGPSIATPEPSSWALMLLGVGFIGAVLRRPRAVLPPSGS